MRLRLCYCGVLCGVLLCLLLPSRAMAQWDYENRQKALLAKKQTRLTRNPDDPTYNYYRSGRVEGGLLNALGGFPPGGNPPPPPGSPLAVGVAPLYEGNSKEPIVVNTLTKVIEVLKNPPGNIPPGSDFAPDKLLKRFSKRTRRLLDAYPALDEARKQKLRDAVGQELNRFFLLRSSTPRPGFPSATVVFQDAVSSRFSQNRKEFEQLYGLLPAPGEPPPPPDKTPYFDIQIYEINSSLSDLFAPSPDTLRILDKLNKGFMDKDLRRAWGKDPDMREWARRKGEQWCELNRRLEDAFYSRPPRALLFLSLQGRSGSGLTEFLPDLLYTDNLSDFSADLNAVFGSGTLPATLTANSREVGTGVGRRNADTTSYGLTLRYELGRTRRPLVRKIEALYDRFDASRKLIKRDLDLIGVECDKKGTLGSTPDPQRVASISIAAAADTLSDVYKAAYEALQEAIKSALHAHTAASLGYTFIDHFGTVGMVGANFSWLRPFGVRPSPGFITECSIQGLQINASGGANAPENANILHGVSTFVRVGYGFILQDRVPYLDTGQGIVPHWQWRLGFEGFSRAGPDIGETWNVFVQYRLNRERDDFLLLNTGKRTDRSDFIGVSVQFGIDL